MRGTRRKGYRYYYEFKRAVSSLVGGKMGRRDMSKAFIVIAFQPQNTMYH